MRVIALHGKPGSGRILRRDVGIPQWEYPTWKPNKYGNWFPDVEPHEKCILAGYSMGGSHIGRLSLSVFGELQVAAAVLYEPPLFGTDRVGGDFPVLWIENNKGRRSWGGRWGREMQDTLEAWQVSHDVEIAPQGKGWHMQPCFGVPPLRHGWDRSLNNYILKWIGRVTCLQPSYCR